MHPQRSLEQQLPRYTTAQADRRTELMTKIEAETTAFRQRIGPYERELSAIERAANT